MFCRIRGSGSYGEKWKARWSPPFCSQLFGSNAPGFLRQFKACLNPWLFNKHHLREATNSFWYILADPEHNQLSHDTICVSDQGTQQLSRLKMLHHSFQVALKLDLTFDYFHTSLTLWLCQCNSL